MFKSILSNMRILASLNIYFKTFQDMHRSAPSEVNLLLGVLFLQSIAPAANLFLIKETINLAVEIDVQSAPQKIILLIAFWGLVMLLGIILSPLSQVIQGNVAEKFTARVNLQLMAKSEEIIGLDLLEDSTYYDDINLLQEGARNRPLNFLVLATSIIRDTAILISISFVLIGIGWWIPIVVILSSVPLARTNLKLREMGWNALISRTPEARKMEYEAKLSLSHEFASEVRLFGLIPWIKDRYISTFLKSHTAMRKVRKQQALQVLPPSIVSIGAVIVLFWWVISQAFAGSISGGEIAAVIAGLSQVQLIVFSFVENVGYLHERTLYFARYFSFLLLQPRVARPLSPINHSLDKSTIEFVNVSLTYPDGRKSLENVSFKINSGETIAIVGENGAGKTTIVKLIMRFYDVTDGYILINGVNIKDIDIDLWRASIGAVFQNFGRYSYTVKENIEIARYLDPDNNEMLNALSISGVQAMLSDIGVDYNAQLGKDFGGTELSGGQWQKIAIARAIYRKAQVLILDEPTAALDPRSEYLLFKQFSDLSRGKTTLLITHRLGSVQMADRILVLKQGKLIEHGTHNALLANGREYSELWQLQKSTYNSAL